MNNEVAELAEVARSLDGVAKLAYTEPSRAFGVLADIPNVTSLSFLRAGVVALIYLHTRPERETAIRERFFRNLHEYLPGATSRPISRVDGRVADGMIEINGRKLPVEIKRATFDRRALDQLLEYIRMYGAEGGIAAAPELSCVLPPNVQFVKVAA